MAPTKGSECEQPRGRPPRDAIEGIGQVDEDKHPVRVVAESMGPLPGGVNNCLAAEPRLHTNLDRVQNGVQRGPHEIGRKPCYKAHKAFRQLLPDEESR